MHRTHSYTTIHHAQHHWTFSTHPTASMHFTKFTLKARSHISYTFEKNAFHTSQSWWKPLKFKVINKHLYERICAGLCTPYNISFLNENRWCTQSQTDLYIARERDNWFSRGFKLYSHTSKIKQHSIRFSKEWLVSKYKIPIQRHMIMAVALFSPNQRFNFRIIPSSCMTVWGQGLGVGLWSVLV